MLAAAGCCLLPKAWIMPLLISVIFLYDQQPPPTPLLHSVSSGISSQKLNPGCLMRRDHMWRVRWKKSPHLDYPTLLSVHNGSGGSKNVRCRAYGSCKFNTNYHNRSKWTPRSLHPFFPLPMLSFTLSLSLSLCTLINKITINSRG